MNKSFKTDIRVVRFAKNFDSNSKTSEAICLTCLGHFDNIQIEKINHSHTNPLSLIGDDCSQDNNDYICSLYVLRQLKKHELESNNSFWENQTRFTSIIRLHCTTPNVDTPLFHSLEGMLKSFKYYSKKKRALLCEDLEHYPVSFCLYDSLELGDTVAFLKSDSLAAIMQVTRLLNSLTNVRDSYTYVGIDSKLIDNPDKDTRPHQETIKIYSSTRFAFKDKSIAPHIMNKIRTWYLTCQEQDSREAEICFVTGTTDYIIDWGSISESMLLKIIREIKSIFQNQNMKIASSDIITRLGLKLNEFDDVKPISSSPTEAQILWNAIIPLRDKLYQITHDGDYKWRLPLRKLLNNLEVMVNNPITDELSLLILPGVHALLVRMMSVLTVPQKHSVDKDIHQFISAWTTLTNSITNMESQLYQHPELSLVQHYIPAMILRFEQEFTRICCQILATPTPTSSTQSRRFSPFVVITQEQRIHTFCPLDPRKEEYDDDCPLLIYLPVKKLYEPWEAAMGLCHEAAHYSGDTIRLRETRAKALIKCVAKFIISFWEIQSGSTPDVSLTQYEQALSKNIEEELFKMCQKHAGHFHLNDVCDILLFEAPAIIADPQRFDSFCNLIIAHQSPADRLVSAINMSNKQAWTPIVEYVSDHIIWLVELCRECYADIVMVVLLDSSLEEYYNSFVKQEYAFVKKYVSSSVDDPMPPEIKKHIDRIAFVMDAARKVSENKRRWDVNILPIDAEWPRKAAQQLNAVYHNKSGWNNTHIAESHVMYLDEVKILQDYFRQCAKKIKEEITCDDSRINQQKLLCDVLHSVKGDEFNWTKIRSFLNQASSLS